MNKKHLTDIEINAIILEPESINKDLLDHIEICPDCKLRLNQIKEFTSTFQTMTMEKEIDWKIEKTRTLANIAGLRKPRFITQWKPVFAMAFCAVIIFVVLFQDSSQKSQPLNLQDDPEFNAIQVFSEDWSIEEPQFTLIYSEYEKADIFEVINLITIYNEEEENNEQEIDYVDIFNTDWGELSYHI